jgi:hypothetical protein
MTDDNSSQGPAQTSEALAHPEASGRAEWPERAADIAWLERQKEGGHCGESTSDVIQRQRMNACIDRLLAALAKAHQKDESRG